jgi:hypothetical protein
MHGQQALEYTGLRRKRSQYVRPNLREAVEQQHQLSHEHRTARQLGVRGLILIQIIRDQETPDPYLRR